ncbi:F-box/kelch-repeat protein At3g23880-like [Bidens hawaiensis]|uniref:F-box/kelch-repeat protein At3g23880-like n=1 Tax=Bidens hawaiensis TaxID=980011 RepID=UPI00404905FC
MKSRSHQMILLHWSLIRGSLVIIDNNVPAHPIVRIRFPVKRQYVHKVTSIVGTFNGIALLALYDDSLHCQLVLYNPLTRASKILVVMDPPSNDHKVPYVFGFGYGETTHDLKIVRRNTEFDVFDVKTSSWSTPQQYMIQWDFYFKDVVGVFVNGFLYWATSKSFSSILALNVKEMVFSQIKLPD